MRGWLTPVTVLLAAACSLTYLVFWDEHGADSTPPPPPLLAVDQSRIAGLEINGPYRIHLQRQGQVWADTQGRGADPGRVADLLWLLSTLHAIRPVTDQPGDLGQWGLNPPRWTITVQTDTGPQILQIGRYLPVTGGYYARRAGDPVIYLIPGTLPESLPAAAADWFSGDI